MGDGFARVLVANRGEIALRVIRAAGALGIATTGVYSPDDATALHVRRCDDAVRLAGSGPAAYLDAAAIVAAAADTGAVAVHPGYGFLSESAELARACAAAGVAFVGPDPEALEVFGDKGRARALAARHRIPVLPGTTTATQLADMEEFASTLDGEAAAAVVVKAVAGGGGRGMRVVRAKPDLAAAFRACQAEALAAFGSGDLYIEQLLGDARHIEVQVAGDGSGQVTHLWDRDCSVQRRHQKLIEVAPGRGLDPVTRERMLAAAVRLTAAVRYRGLATVEFLLAPDGGSFFLEVNPRLQVEHTVTEEVLGIDLVEIQFAIAAGASLGDLGLTQERVPAPRGAAIQVRLNAETMTPDGRITPAGGQIRQFDMPAGHGVRVETAGYRGYALNPRFDSLLAKIVVHDRTGFPAARRLAQQALRETWIDGVPTNLSLQRAILDTAEFADGRCDTGYVDVHARALLAAAGNASPPGPPAGHPASAGPALADAPEGASVITAPMAGSVTAVTVGPGETVTTGQAILVLEAMKMQHVIQADTDGQITGVLAGEGDVVAEGDALAILLPAEGGSTVGDAASETDPGYIRPDLAALRDRAALLTDEQRPGAVRRRHAQAMRTARENVADLADAGSFTEYGGYAVAAQRTRRDLDDLIRHTPADGIITGTATVNGALFAPDRTRCAILAYDYTVLAGTQGYFSHKKADRILQVAQRHHYPVVLFAEGGGGRPGDLDVPKVAGLNTATFSALGALSGTVPLIGVAAGRCFAGNAALLGTCDVVIATKDANIGMGGPAMVEGAGLGAFAPEEIGPIGVQTANGVVDIAVTDEEEAVAAARKYLSYFQGGLADSRGDDQRKLRHVVPENRKRAYDIRTVASILCDTGSVLELRQQFGRTILTALIRIGGQPMGLVANNPAVLGGAIDADGADKAARFLQLCDVFGMPVVSLCDTPGFMVGPDAETTATVRHFSRLFVRGANMTVPMVTVVLRKGYGLGAMAMASGSFAGTSATVSWPTGEFGGMGLEGAVRLGFRRELAAIGDPQARERRYEELVTQMYERRSALNTAMHLEIDNVIDPADTRGVILASLPPAARQGWVNPRLRSFVDTW